MGQPIFWTGLKALAAKARPEGSLLPNLPLHDAENAD
jgi:hypothetical protein